MHKSTIKNAPNPTSSGSGEGKHDLIDRRAAIDTIMGQPPEPHYPSWYAAQIEKLPAAQPELIAQDSYVRGFEQGRTQGMIDSKCGRKMKKAEAISILATSIRPREPKDRARYDEAVKMAIEALKCSEIPNGSDDTISRQAAIDAINTWDKFGVDERGRLVRWHEGMELYVHLRDVFTAIVNLPSAQPDPAKIMWQ